MNGYHYGLTRKAAAYTEKKYCGYHILPLNILKELDFEGQLELVS